MTATRSAAVPWRDVALAVGSFALGAVLLASGLQLFVRFGQTPVWPAPWWFRLAVLAAICLAQLLRTRAPVLGLGIGVLVAAGEAPVGLSLAVLLVLGDLLYSATLNGSQRANRVIIAVVGTLMLGTAIAPLVLAWDWRTALLTILQVCTFPLIPVWWAMNVRQHRQIARAERARADQVARIAELDRKAAIAAERSRMARDLHDVIAGHLSAIAIQSEAVLSIVDGAPDTVRAVLRSVRENSVASLTEMRTMIGLLRADDGEPAEPLTAPARLRDLEPLLTSARAAGLEVSATTTGLEPDLPVAVDLSAYRIVQEALTNAVKHAPGSRAEVTVGMENGTLVIDVTNRRTSGGAPATEGGTGLVSMRERAQAVGGVLVAGPSERGWQVRAELPVEGRNR